MVDTMMMFAASVLQCSDCSTAVDMAWGRGGRCRGRSCHSDAAVAIATFLGRPAPPATGCVEICCYRLPAHTAHCPVWTRAANDPSVFTMTEKAPIRASSWLKALTSAFTFKTLLCDCENRWIVCSSSLDTVAAQAYLIPQSPHSLHCTTLHNTTALVR